MKKNVNKLQSYSVATVAVAISVFKVESDD